MVLSTDDDPHATAANAGLRPLLRNPAQLHHITLTQIAAQAAREVDLRDWARLLSSRYLDL